ncbi:hypothetical protein DT019_10145 [Streptomyces sp. SDr-06]|nr:hypothetical protein DT019_10145 [Streptomyces sp. SDr-06]
MASETGEVSETGEAREAVPVRRPAVQAPMDRTTTVGPFGTPVRPHDDEPRRPAPVGDGSAGLGRAR